MISNIKKNVEPILKFVSALYSEMAVHQENITRRPENEKIDSAVYTWLKNTLKDNRFWDQFYEKKECMFNETLGADSMFRTSLSWLRNFCQAWNL